MLIVLLVLFFVCIYKIKFCKRYEYFTDYLSIEKTTSIKGIFILLVFLSHFGSYAEFSNAIDLPYIKLRSLWGQTIVTMFLFYSGYGVVESIKRKKDYVDNIIVNRVLKVLINFDLAIIIFWLVQTYFGKKYTLKRIILTFIGWDGIGNSNWFIFSIIVTYIFTYISFKVYKKSRFKAIMAVSILTLIFMSYMSIYKDAYWYDTIFCYSIGMWYSLYREKIEGFILESDQTYLFSLIISILVFIITHKYLKNFFVYEIWIFSFVAIVLLLTMKISFHNVILQWLGKNLFGLYILQRIPMLIFKNIHIDKINIYLYFILSFIVTIIIAAIFNKLTSKIHLDNLFNKKKG